MNQQWPSFLTHISVSKSQCVIYSIYHIKPSGSFHYTVRCIIIIFRKVSNAWGQCLDFNHFDIRTGISAALLSTRHLNLSRFELPISSSTIKRCYNKTWRNTNRETINITKHWFHINIMLYTIVCLKSEFGHIYFVSEMISYVFRLWNAGSFTYFFAAMI